MSIPELTIFGGMPGVSLTSPGAAEGFAAEVDRVNGILEKAVADVTAAEKRISADRKLTAEGKAAAKQAEVRAFAKLLVGPPGSPASPVGVERRWTKQLAHALKETKADDPIGLDELSPTRTDRGEPALMKSAPMIQHDAALRLEAMRQDLREMDPLEARAAVESAARAGDPWIVAAWESLPAYVRDKLDPDERAVRLTYWRVKRPEAFATAQTVGEARQLLRANVMAAIRTVEKSMRVSFSTSIQPHDELAELWEALGQPVLEHAAHFDNLKKAEDPGAIPVPAS